MLARWMREDRPWNRAVMTCPMDGLMVEVWAGMSWSASGRTMRVASPFCSWGQGMVPMAEEKEWLWTCPMMVLTSPKKLAT